MRGDWTRASFSVNPPVTVHIKATGWLISPFYPFQVEEELSGIVEVVGTVSNKATLMATAYTILREDKEKQFGTWLRPVFVNGGRAVLRRL